MVTITTILVLPPQSGQVIKPNTRVLNAGGHSRIMHTPAAVSLESRSIRLGSLKGTPFERVIMTPTGINIKMECRSRNFFPLKRGHNKANIEIYWKCHLNVISQFKRKFKSENRVKGV